MKSVGIFTALVDGVPPWDPDSIHKGITGSEEAVIYMAQQLAALGMRVIVLGAPPAGSRHSLEEANPRFIDSRVWRQEMLDIAISWRMPRLGSKLRSIARRVYLWPHDLCHEPLSREDIEAFDDVLWLSQWQRNQWISMNPHFQRFQQIFGNGINPEQFGPISRRENPFSCIYGSNYGRGLEELIDLWPAIQERFPLATLDVYYGWQHWGLLKPYEERVLRQKMGRLPSVFEHGLVSHEELTCAYEKASLWTYPCKRAETFCITALRTQFAGAIPVVVQDFALHETVRHGYRCQRLEDYPALLMKALGESGKITLETRAKMAEFILQNYTWKDLASRWMNLFNKES